ncbi:squalene/phytoene synthase family protein [Streptomyces bottropensis]|uniref:squalene/phytoene synthase family protein n=1 Tax=Streptomyces bottropensis TaxID=42235 RepID=UPI00368F098D
MSTWKQSLDAAGVRDPKSRRDYDRQRDLVARARRTSYLAARLLLPRALLPHVVAATAMMHHSDDLLDTGPKQSRVSAWASWEREVRGALETGVSTDPLIRALLNSAAARPGLRVAVERYLDTATADLEFTGFATEADYQAYVDAYSLPAFMLVASLLGPEGDDGRFRAACRTLMEGSQRLDFVNDLAEDLPEGRLGIPAETLKRFSVTAEDLAEGRESSGVRELVEDQIEASRVRLRAARALPVLTQGPGGVLLRTVVDIELLTADAAFARGARLLRGSASPSVPATARTLLGARRTARGVGGARGAHGAP